MHFDIEVFVRAAPPRVHALLADLRNHCEFHPLLVKVEELPRDPSLPDTQRCRVFDRMKLGPLPLRFSYLATMRAESDLVLVGEARAFPGIRTHTRFTLVPEPAGTRVVEHAEIRAPRLLLRYTAATAKAAHTESLTRLAALLEPSGSPQD